MNTGKTIFIGKAPDTATYSLEGYIAKYMPSTRAPLSAQSALDVATYIRNKFSTVVSSSAPASSSRAVSSSSAPVSSSRPVSSSSAAAPAPKLSFVFPVNGSNIARSETLGDFTAAVRFADANSGKALPIENLVITEEANPDNINTFTDTPAGYTDGTNGLWVKKGLVSNGRNTLKATGTYNGNTYTATITVNNSPVIHPESMVIGVKDKNIKLYNGLSNVINTYSLLDASLSELALPEIAQPFAPRLIEYESELTNGWGYSLAKANQGYYYILRAKQDGNNQSSLKYIQVKNNLGTVGDTLQDPSSLFLDQNDDAIGANDRLLVLQHPKDQPAFVSALNVGNKDLTSNSIPKPMESLFGPYVDSLYTTIWTQPQGLTNPDQVAFDATTKTLVVLDKKAGSSWILGYTSNTGTAPYTTESFRMEIGSNNGRLVTSGGKVYVSETLDGQVNLLSIDIAAKTKTTLYDGSVGTGPLLQSITDMRFNRLTSQMYIADAYSSRLISLNVNTLERKTLVSFGAGSGQAIAPNDIDCDHKNDTCYLADSISGGIVSLNKNDGSRVLLRGGITHNGQTAAVKDIRFVEGKGLLTSEMLAATDSTAAETGLALCPASGANVTADLLSPFSPNFVVDYLGVYSQAAYGDYALSINATTGKVNIAKLGASQTTVYTPDNSLNLSSDQVTAVEVDTPNGLLYFIHNEFKTLYSVDLHKTNAMPQTAAKLETFNIPLSPSDIAVDGNKVYFLAGTGLYKADRSLAKLFNVSYIGTPGIGYEDGYSARGAQTFGERLSIDKNAQVAWITNKRGGAVVAISLITGDRVIVAH